MDLRFDLVNELIKLETVLNACTEEAEEKQTFSIKFEDLLVEGEDLLIQIHKAIRDLHDNANSVNHVRMLHNAFVIESSNLKSKIQKAVIEGSGFRRRNLKSRKRKDKKRKRS